MAVIGTLLALLVFFALFGLFLTQYVPIWMGENEAGFTSAAGASFAQLKADIDTQYVLGVPPTLGTPFTISSGNIPLIAQPTQGSLVFVPQTCPRGFYALGVTGATSANYGQPVNSSYCVFENQSLSIGPGGSGPYYLTVPTGILSMELPNRYYPSQFYQLEADGVVQVQSGGLQQMAYSPPFNVTSLAGNTTVSSSFLQLYGNATTITGQGSEDVYSHLRFTQHLASVGSPTLRYTFEIGTQYPCAWSKFLWHQLNVSGVIPSGQYSFSPYTGSCNNPTGVTTDLTLALTAVNYASIYYAGVILSVGIGGA
ncbi:MAG TPA: hypothetical protein VEE83_01110 [Thermoplasmata archaeon]|nr:hypothetical protein [Thermoplasmata archaeon]